MAQSRAVSPAAGHHAVRKATRAQLRTGWQEKRRTEALDRQQKSRQANLELRRFARDVEESESCFREHHRNTDDLRNKSGSVVRPQQTEDVSTEEVETKPTLSLTQQYANKLMVHEWMTEVPSDLNSNWYVAARPEGQRCLVIATGGTTTSRLRNGAVLHTFASALPSGSSAAQSMAQGPTVLDCIFQEQTGCYWVLDAISWNGFVLADCNAEFRISFWVQSKLSELQPVPGAAPFRAVPFAPCTADGLQSAHSGPSTFVRDGCVFMHKLGLYTLRASPLALVWKDGQCSRYLLDTDPAGNVPERQMLTLAWQMGGTVATEDDPPVVLGQMPAAFLQALGRKLRPGLLLKFAIGPGGIAFSGGVPTGADLCFLGPANQRRGRADAFSKVLFQFLARTNPLQMDHLMAAIDQMAE